MSHMNGNGRSIREWERLCDESLIESSNKRLLEPKGKWARLTGWAFFSAAVVIGTFAPLDQWTIGAVVVLVGGAAYLHGPVKL